MFLIIAAVSVTTPAPAAGQEGSSNWDLVTAAPAGFSPRNVVELEGDRLLWNGSEVSEKQAGEYLTVVRNMKPQPPTILRHGDAVPEVRLQRVRTLIDNVLHCKPSTCVEVTAQAR